MQRQKSRLKAIDEALWRNCNHRYNNDYAVVHSTSDDYIIIERDHPTFRDGDFETLPEDYVNMDYKHIQSIAMDEDPLHHWEEIKGLFSTMHGEILRFLLHYKVPLNKFIRWELACRGYDKDFQWVGFDRSEEIWLTDN